MERPCNGSTRGWWIARAAKSSARCAGRHARWMAINTGRPGMDQKDNEVAYGSCLSSRTILTKISSSSAVPCSRVEGKANKRTALQWWQSTLLPLNIMTIDNIANDCHHMFFQHPPVFNARYTPISQPARYPPNAILFLVWTQANRKIDAHTPGICWL